MFRLFRNTNPLSAPKLLAAAAFLTQVAEAQKNGRDDSDLPDGIRIGGYVTLIVLAVIGMTCCYRACHQDDPQNDFRHLPDADIENGRGFGV